MKVFVTGASGFIGQAVVRELKAAGHAVVGLARNEEGMERVRRAGGEAVLGDLKDVELLAKRAKAADAVVHLAFIHDFANFQASIVADRDAVQAMATALEGSNKPIVITSGTAGGKPGGTFTENDAASGGFAEGRGATETLLLGYAKKGVRAMVMRLPQVHAAEDKHGFVPILIGFAKKNGVAVYIGDGRNRWSAVHRDDAARAYRLALDKGEAGARYHAVAEPAIPTREIAEDIADGLGVPAKSVTQEDAPKYIEWMAMFYGSDAPTTSAITQEKLGWSPKGPTLAEDMKAYYFAG